MSHPRLRILTVGSLIAAGLLTITRANDLLIRPDLSHAIIAIQQIFVNNDNNNPTITLDGSSGSLSLSGTLQITNEPCRSTTGCVIMTDEDGHVITTGVDAIVQPGNPDDLDADQQQFFAKKGGTTDQVDTTVSEIFFGDPGLLETPNPALRVGINTLNSATTPANDTMLEVAGSINTRTEGLTLQSMIDPSNVSAYILRGLGLVDFAITRGQAISNNELSARIRLWYTPDNRNPLNSNLIIQGINLLSRARLGINLLSYPTRELDIDGTTQISQMLTVGSGFSPLLIADSATQRVAINTTPSDHTLEVKGATRLGGAVNFAGIPTSRSNTTDGQTSIKLGEINSLETTPYTYTGMGCKYLSVDAQGRIILVQGAGSGCGAPTLISRRFECDALLDNDGYWNTVSGYTQLSTDNGITRIPATTTTTYNVTPSTVSCRYTCNPGYYYDTYYQACILEDDLWIGGGGGGGFYGCFVKDTQVNLNDGSTKDIQDIQIGDILQGSQGNNIVQEIITYNHTGLIYSFNGGRYFVTESHPFMTTEGWKSINPEATKEIYPDLEVTALRPGSIMITDHGQIPLFIVQSKELSQKVYTFNVDGSHDFYADGYLVHNKYASTTTCNDDGECNTTCPPPAIPNPNGGNACVYRHSDPVCGPAHNSIGTTRPTSGLCNEGTASSVVGSGPWTWTCRSAGKTVSCKKNIP